MVLFSGLFNFQSILTILLLMCCTCAYVRNKFKTYIDKYKTGFSGIFWKFARIGERASLFVSFACLIMAVATLYR
jgi:hypothetical protein